MSEYAVLGDNGVIKSPAAASGLSVLSNVNYLAVAGCGFALAFDFAVVAISIQSYWLILAPDKESLYGFAFGCYDLAQFMCAPLVGYLSDIIGLRSAFSMCLLLNIIGNIFYATAYYTDDGTWQFIILGRMVAGIGSAALSLGVAYVTKTSRLEDRVTLLGYYRMSQTLARVGGPFLPMLLLGMSMSINSDNSTQLLLNFYTIPGWVAAGVSTLCFFFLLSCFRNPTHAELHGAEHQGKTFDPRNAPNLMYHVKILLAVQFIATFAMYIYYSQLFGFAAGQYHLLESSSHLWVTYVALGVGAGTASMYWRRTKAVIQDWQYVNQGLIAFVASTALLMDWNGSGGPPSSTFFYLGTGAMGFGMITFYAMMESFYSKKLTQFGDEAGDRVGLIAALLPAAGALGRFLGPTIAGYWLIVEQNSLSQLAAALGMADTFDEGQAYGDDGETYLSDAYTAAKAAGYPIDSMCYLSFPQYYFYKGCSLNHVNTVLPIMGITLFAIYAYMKFTYFPKFKSSVRSLVDMDDSRLSTNQF